MTLPAQMQNLRLPLFIFPTPDLIIPLLRETMTTTGAICFIAACVKIFVALIALTGPPNSLAGLRDDASIALRLFILLVVLILILVHAISLYLPMSMNCSMNRREPMSFSTRLRSKGKPCWTSAHPSPAMAKLGVIGRR